MRVTTSRLVAVLFPVSSGPDRLYEGWYAIRRMKLYPVDSAVRFNLSILIHWIALNLFVG